MKITQVDSFLMSCQMPEPVKLRFLAGERTILKRDAMLIRITTDTGLRGYAPGPAHERADKEIKQTIAPFLIGRDPCSWGEFHFTAEQQIMRTYKAVEIALLDLVARYEGCTLSALLGGRKRDRIKLYGSAGMYMEPEQYAEEVSIERVKEAAKRMLCEGLDIELISRVTELSVEEIEKLIKSTK